MPGSPRNIQILYQRGSVTLSLQSYVTCALLLLVFNSSYLHSQPLFAQVLVPVELAQSFSLYSRECIRMIQDLTPFLTPCVDPKSFYVLEADHQRAQARYSLSDSLCYNFHVAHTMRDNAKMLSEASTL